MVCLLCAFLSSNTTGARLAWALHSLPSPACPSIFCPFSLRPPGPTRSDFFDSCLCSVSVPGPETGLLLGSMSVSGTSRRQAGGSVPLFQARDMGTGMGRMLPSHLNESYVTLLQQQQQEQKQISLPNYVLFGLILKLVHILSGRIHRRLDTRCWAKISLGFKTLATNSSQPECPNSIYLEFMRNGFLSPLILPSVFHPSLRSGYPSSVFTSSV